MAPFVGLGSTILVPSLLKALPALKARTISDSRMDIIMRLVSRLSASYATDQRDASVIDDFKVRFSHHHKHHFINCYTMQYDDYSIDEGPTWGVRSPRDGDGDLGMVKDTMRKEQVIKSVLSTSRMFLFWVLSLRSGRSWLHKRI